MHFPRSLGGRQAYMMKRTRTATVPLEIGFASGCGTVVAAMESVRTMYFRWGAENVSKLDFAFFFLGKFAMGLCALGCVLAGFPEVWQPNANDVASRCDPAFHVGQWRPARQRRPT